ncbi:hypothetical protein [Sphaerisporangium album]|uniref:hypothetical protein n=1 Tax=Sphaerisporangium album TaxID=509200 RepID=UPI0011C038F1|nr:hypothetical protein [Sphaerisporangium album]
MPYFLVNSWWPLCFLVLATRFARGPWRGARGTDPVPVVTRPDGDVALAGPGPLTLRAPPGAGHGAG